jgi:hypothetical protein
MKSLPVKVITFVLSAFLMACGTGNAEQPKAEPTPDHVHSFSTADCENPSICTVCGLENEPALGHTVSIGMCSRCGQLVNAEHLEKFRTDMVKVTEVGAKIPQFFLNVDGKGAAEHYSAFTACDPVIDEFNKALETVLDDCEGYDEFNFIVYQIRLMMNRTPTKTSSTDYSYLQNKTYEYIYFLNQFSNSIGNITSEIYALYGQQGTLVGDVRYFDEMEDMPVPDNVMLNVRYLSEESDSGEKRYNYVIDDPSDNYDSNLKNYLFLLDHSEGLSVEESGNEYHVIRNGRSVSVIRYAKSAGSQPVMTVVFPD